MDEKILTLVKNCDLSKPMFRARSSEVFDLGDEKVLKLYFDSVSKENVDIELLNTTVAFETGCTPMECFGKVEVNGRQGLVFKKLYGESLTNMPMKTPRFCSKQGKSSPRFTLMFIPRTPTNSATSDKSRSKPLTTGFLLFFRQKNPKNLKTIFPPCPKPTT